jgi:hypothetical protein
MHACWEGVTKRFLKAWFDSKHHKEPFYFGPDLRDKFESLMKQVKFPHDFSSPARSWTIDGKFWKGKPDLVTLTNTLVAVEFKNFALYLFAPIMEVLVSSIEDEERKRRIQSLYQHFVKFTKAVSILNQRSISPTEVNDAERLLLEFERETDEKYGVDFKVINVHYMIHLCYFVRKYGPFWTHNSFWAERMNHHLNLFMKGNRYYMEQIATALQAHQAAAVIEDKIPSGNM